MDIRGFLRNWWRIVRSILLGERGRGRERERGRSMRRWRMRGRE